MTRAGPSIAFLESEGQADAVLRLSQRPDVLIPLAPAAAYRLEREGVLYRKPEEFYDERSLADASDPVLDAQSAWADRTDAWISERVQVFREASFRPARNHFIHLKMLLDALRIRATVLEGVFQALQPAQAFYFRAPGEGEVRSDLHFRESLNARCLPAWAVSHGIAIEPLAMAGDERYDFPPRKRRLSFSAAARILRHRVATLIPRKRARVLLRPEYDVESLVGPLANRGASLSLWGGFLHRAVAAGRRAPEAWAKAYPELLGTESFRKPLHIGGLDFTAAAEARFRHWCERLVPEAWATFTGARRLFREQGISCVVVPFADDHRDAAVLQAAQAEKVPVVVYQHGGFGGACEYAGWEISDLRFSDVMLFYGEDGSRHYEQRLRRYSDKRGVPVAVGSARLDALVRPCSPRRQGPPTVLYFPGMHAGYTRYLCCGEMPDVSHWELQRDIVRTFKRFPNVQLLYRPFEGRFKSPVPGLLARELPGARIDALTPLPELVWTADLILTDIPSTGLLEALLTDRPLLAYADPRSIRMTPRAKDLLRRRSKLDETPEDFLRTIAEFLERGDFRPLPEPDPAFLRGYGTHLGDGRSAQRAADVVAGLWG